MPLARKSPLLLIGVIPRSPAAYLAFNDADEQNREKQAEKRGPSPVAQANGIQVQAGREAGESSRNHIFFRVRTRQWHVRGVEMAKISPSCGRSS
jgi:hypothetical protein